MISHTSWWFIFQDQAVAVSDSNPDTMLNPKIGGIIKTTSWLAHESDGDIIRGSSTNTLLCRALMISVLLCTVYHLLPHCCNCEPEGSDCGWPVCFIYHLFGKEYSFDVHSGYLSLLCDWTYRGLCIHNVIMCECCTHVIVHMRDVLLPITHGVRNGIRIHAHIHQKLTFMQPMKDIIMLSAQN